jgi:CYTH domain-containing protein
VRSKTGTAATLTIKSKQASQSRQVKAGKSKQAELRRLEVECPITVLDAEALIAYVMAA